MTSASPWRDGDPLPLRFAVAGGGSVDGTGCADGAGCPDVPDPGQRRKEAAQWLRRRRLERQLHDGASLRISALSLRLGLLRYQETGDEAAWQDRIGELQDELHAVLQELREVANKIYPPLLDEAGLGPALRELAGQRGIEVQIDADGDRFGPVPEGAAYFAVAECLGPGSDGAGPVTVAIRRDRRELVLAVRGLDPANAEVMLDQAGPLGGTVHLDRRDTETDSDSDETPTITVRIPCE